MKMEGMTPIDGRGFLSGRKETIANSRLEKLRHYSPTFHRSEGHLGNGVGDDCLLAKRAATASKVEIWLLLCRSVDRAEVEVTWDFCTHDREIWRLSWSESLPTRQYQCPNSKRARESRCQSYKIFNQSFVLLGSIFPVLSGVAVGAGLQTKVAVINLVCFYFIGLTIGAVLRYVVHLQVKRRGPGSNSDGVLDAKNQAGMQDKAHSVGTRPLEGKVIGMFKNIEFVEKLENSSLFITSAPKNIMKSVI
ncbi:MATE efflux family protein [Perilla frutescens var. hirtella]|nr:MATE efflux family protein [Perilla frutescens var. frutescens]KAH6786891.1 MATE efflux family protein [Perilla frutescens var. hirtella]